MVLFWRNNKHSFGRIRNLPLAPFVRSEQRSHTPVHSKKVIGDSLPNCSIGEVPPSSSKPTIDQRLMSLERMLKDQ